MQRGAALEVSLFQNCAAPPQTKSLSANSYSNYTKTFFSSGIPLSASELREPTIPAVARRSGKRACLRLPGEDLETLYPNRAGKNTALNYGGSESGGASKLEKILDSF